MSDDRPEANHVVEMTVARVRGRKADADHIEVLFLQSARFYRLSASHPEFDSILELLRESQAAGRPLKVRFASPDADDIEAAGEA